MATMTITIPDNKLQEVLDGTCYAFGYTDTVEDGFGGPQVPNPITKAEFAKTVVVRFIKDSMARHKRSVSEIVVQSELAAIDIT